MNDNLLIEHLLSSLELYGDPIPVAQAMYLGNEDNYVVYSLQGSSEPFFSDDKMVIWKNYYDVDIYSKRYLAPIATQVRSILEEGGFDWQPSRSSGDLYELDTGYHHRTLCFLKLYQEVR